MKFHQQDSVEIWGLSTKSQKPNSTMVSVKPSEKMVFIFSEPCAPEFQECRRVMDDSWQSDKHVI